ncbi:PBP1A family penicillin-binding protein [Candidatus Palauibacter sp.]|uniref:PBP1A family penicillin-binding protein n=1 Tax=Candidatus Palauibacter sp. TaxID=3101350 RepID=UPI003C7052F4
MRHRRKARGWLPSGGKRPRGRWLVLLAAAILAAGLGYLAFEARVAREFDARNSISPTSIVARPWFLHPGDRVDPQRVIDYLDRAGYRRVSGGTPESGEYGAHGRELLVGRRAIRLGGMFDPGVRVRIRFRRDGRISAIRSAEGPHLAGLLLDPEVIGKAPGDRNRDRVVVRFDEVPDHLVDALLTVEDRRFYDHGALDPRRIAGAALSNLRQGRVAEGGSTITQQLARTLFLSTDRTVFRKLREAAIAVALERRFPKRRLLESYMNHIYLGQNGGAGIHGFGRAAQFFFDRDIAELTLGQSALLVGIIRGPSRYAPHRHPERARARRDVVLRQLHALGHIDGDRLEDELRAAVDIRMPAIREMDARWYLDFVRRELASGEPALEVSGGGFTVVSSLVPELQRAAERAVSDGLRRLERLQPRLTRQPRPLQAALIAIDPPTGEVLAMVGGRSYGASQFNRATDARRQPGSAFKPLVALAALDPRVDPPYTLASVLRDEPLELETPVGVWRPSNADRAFLGPINLRDALVGSRNVPFARLGLEVGPERIVETARRLGIESPLAPYPSLALGASEVTLLELTGAYAVLAAEGRRASPRTVRGVLDRSGRSVRERPRAGESVITPAEAYLVTSALRGVVEEGTGSGVLEAGYRGPVAAKSGTTNGSRDAWFVGYTPELAVGVWVGFDDGARVGLPGSRAALPIFADFLIRVLGPGGGRDFRFPEGVEWVDIEPATGRRAGWGCRGEPELFLAGTAPEAYCGYRPGPWRRRTLSPASPVITDDARNFRRGRDPGRAGGPGAPDEGPHAAVSRRQRPDRSRERHVRPAALPSPPEPR